MLVYEMALGGVSPRGINLQKPKRGRSLRTVQLEPEVQPSELLRLIYEVTDKLTTWRNAPPQQPVQRHLKIVSNQDQPS